MKMRFMLMTALSVYWSLRADAIDNLKPGEWYEVPNTHLYDVKPAGFSGNVIEPWSSGALDAKRNRMILWGGGHSDYQGNEVYAFDLNTLKWSRLWGPTPLAQIPGSGNNETYLDGNPGSRHTYDGLTYLPDPIDALWACSGALWQGGGGSNATWLFKFGTGQWERKADFPGNAAWQVCGYDSAKGLVIAEGMNWTCEYNAGTNTWVKRYENGAGWWNDSRKGEIDPVRRIMVILGNGNCHLYNLDTYTSTNITNTSTGDTQIIGADAPGLAYDAKSGKMVAWNGGTSVYTFDITARQWTRVQPAATNTADPGPTTSTGTYGRWRYIPSRNAFFVVNGITKNVFFYKLTAGAGTAAEAGAAKGGVSALTVSPNPFRSTALIHAAGAAKIYDLNGRMVADLSHERKMNGTVTWRPANLSAGLYVVKTQWGTRSLSATLFYQK